MSRSLEDDARGSARRDAKPGGTAGIDASRLPITVRRVGKSFIASTFPRRQSSLAMALTVHAVVVLKMLSGLRLQGMSARLPADELRGAHSARKAREDVYPRSRQATGSWEIGIRRAVGSGRKTSRKGEGISGVSKSQASRLGKTSHIGLHRHRLCPATFDVVDILLHEAAITRCVGHHPA